METLWRQVSVLALFSIRSIVGTVHVARASNGAHLFTTDLPRPSHLFYMNRFFSESAVKRSRLHEYERFYLVKVFCNNIICSNETATQ